MAKWVKNPAAAARVAVEVQVRSPAQPNGLKYLALPEPHCKSQTQSPAQELPYAAGTALKSKNKNKGLSQLSHQPLLHWF